ncbi:glycoside hydrolase family 5 protein [Mycena galopus ATCC 62051]|nr:glycoside hydrolase family 5 protein [Mycena galopus ATCC 62051]
MARFLNTLRALLGFSLVSSVVAFTPGFAYGTTKVRGVNLGGWLVLEPWITPSLFDDTGNTNIVDEWTFGQLQSKATATAALTTHWNTWITESDFEAIAAAKLNHVRLPIGYWAWDISGGEPYIQGQLAYLTKAVQWASDTGLKVIIDLHGAPGSQNGFDNSGHRGAAAWANDGTSGSDVQRTDAIIKQIANLYKDNTNVVPTIAPLNEPAGYDGSNWLAVITQYWYDSFGNVRFPYGTSQQSNTVVLLHDAFQPLSYWSGLYTYPNYQGVAVSAQLLLVIQQTQRFGKDGHSYLHYLLPSGRGDVTVGTHPDRYVRHILTWFPLIMEIVCNMQNELSTFDLWLIVGEWTPAFTDCATYLNGRGIGARYDGSYSGSNRVGSCTGLTGSASTFSSSYKTFLRQFWEAQVISYEMAEGWIQWLVYSFAKVTWKTESADEWSYSAGLANGWIPQDPTDLMYPNICSTA